MPTGSIVLETLFLTGVIYWTLRPLKSAKFLRTFWTIMSVLVVAWFLQRGGWLSLMWLLGKAGLLLPILFVILFQNDIKTKMGGISLKGWLGGVVGGEDGKEEIVSTILGAIRELRRSRLGALFVFEGETSLSSVLGDLGGVSLNASLSIDLIKSIFHTHSPLHDGAVIIRKGRIKKAQVIIPLPAGGSGMAGFGTRHRAGKSASSGTDALSVILSEETGKVSLCMRGQIQEGIDLSTVQRILLEEL